MRTLILAAIALSSAIIVTGCSLAATPAPTTVTVVAPATAVPANTVPAPNPAPATQAATRPPPSPDAQGNLPKAFGQSAGYSAPHCAGTAAACELVGFSLDKVTGCTGSYPGPLDKGLTRIVVWMTIHTTRLFDPAQSQVFAASDFHMISPNGLATGDISPRSTWECVPNSAQLPLRWQPNTTYSVQIELDSPYPHGRLVLVPSFMTRGWAWNI